MAGMIFKFFILLLSFQFFQNGVHTVCQMHQMPNKDVYCDCKSLFKILENGFIITISTHEKGEPFLKLEYRGHGSINAQIHLPMLNNDDVKDILILNRYEFLIIKFPKSRPSTYFVGFGEGQHISTMIHVHPAHSSDVMEAQIREKLKYVKARDHLTLSPFKIGTPLVVIMEYMRQDELKFHCDENIPVSYTSSLLQQTRSENDTYKKITVTKSQFPSDYQIKILFSHIFDLNEIYINTPHFISVQKFRSAHFVNPTVVSIINGELANQFNLDRVCLIVKYPHAHAPAITIYLRQTDQNYIVNEEDLKAAGIFIDMNRNQVCLSPREICGRSYLMVATLAKLNQKMYHTLEPSCQTDFVKYLKENIKISSTSEETSLTIEDSQYLKIISIGFETNVKSLHFHCIIDRQTCLSSNIKDLPITCTFEDLVVRCSHSAWTDGSKTIIFHVSFDEINYVLHSTISKTNELKVIKMCKDISNFRVNSKGIQTIHWSYIPRFIFIHELKLYHVKPQDSQAVEMLSCNFNRCFLKSRRAKNGSYSHLAFIQTKKNDIKMLKFVITCEVNHNGLRKRVIVTQHVNFESEWRSNISISNTIIMVKNFGIFHMDDILSKGKRNVFQHNISLHLATNKVPLRISDEFQSYAVSHPTDLQMIYKLILFRNIDNLCDSTINVNYDYEWYSTHYSVVAKYNLFCVDKALKGLKDKYNFVSDYLYTHLSNLLSKHDSDTHIELGKFHERIARLYPFCQKSK